MSENTGSKVSYFLVGLGVGTLLGILFAPKSGEETREYLKDKADEGREFAQKKARELRERAEELSDRARDTVERQKDQIANAIDAGTEAYQRAKKH
jgi:gas vesicle protein